jgi:hypothetical protein
MPGAYGRGVIRFMKQGDVFKCIECEEQKRVCFVKFLNYYNKWETQGKIQEHRQTVVQCLVCHHARKTYTDMTGNICHPFVKDFVELTTEELLEI